MLICSQTCVLVIILFLLLVVKCLNEKNNDIFVTAIYYHIKQYVSTLSLQFSSYYIAEFKHADLPVDLPSAVSKMLFVDVHALFRCNCKVYGANGLVAGRPTGSRYSCYGNSDIGV